MSARAGAGHQRLVIAWFAVAALAMLLPGASALRFDEVAAQEHVTFARAGDMYDPDPSFVELMGGGACWLDYDHDGEQDLFLVNGWYNDTRLAAARQPHSELYRNLGPGLGFADVTSLAGLDVRGWTQGCSAGDYDGDGWLDLFVEGFGIQSLFHNNGDGTFTNVTAGSGISAAGKCARTECWGSGSAWADYDRDGCLDLVVVNFVYFNITEGGLRGPPTREGQPEQLYHSDCDGTFTDVTAAAGADGNPGPGYSKAWAVSWLDYDRDGWLDMYITSDGTPNVLYRNNHDGTFTNTAQDANVADPRNGMGLATGDCNEDGFEELFFTHYASFPGPAAAVGYDGFYVNDGDGTFTDHSGEGDLANDVGSVKWGTGWEDFDNDGNQDIHVATGHTEPKATTSYADQKPYLWLGDGACHFTDISDSAGPGLKINRTARGTAYADYDHDGVMDIAQVNLVDEPMLLLKGSGVTGHWLTLELRQPGMNGYALGADVNVTLPGGKVLHRRMMPYQSIHGNDAFQVHVGLGDATDANITVRWPEDLATTQFAHVGADRVLRLSKDGSVQGDLLAPRTTVLVDGAAALAHAWHQAPALLQLTASDTAVGPASGVERTELTLDGTLLVDPAPRTLGEGRHDLRVRSVDAAGNAEPARSLMVGVDSVAPSATTLLAGDLQGGWYHGPVTATVTCTDATSGVAAQEWRLDEGPWQPYQASLQLTRPGAHTFTWRCTDAAGNVAENSSLLSIDLGFPQTLAVVEGPAGTNGWWRGDVTVAFDAAAGLHAVTAVHASLDGGPWNIADGPLAVQGDGTHTLRFRADDDAGRSEPVESIDVRIDSTPPSIHAEALTRHVDRDGLIVVGTAHAVGFGATDATSGVALVEAHREGEPFAVQPRPMEFLYDGLHTLSVRATDAAGNVALLDQPVYLDTTPPRVDVASPRDQSINVGEVSFQLPFRLLSDRAVIAGSVPFEASLAPDMSGIARVTFLVDGQVVGTVDEAPWVWHWSLPPDREHISRNVRIVAEDGVGNRGPVEFKVSAVGDPAALLPVAPAHGAPAGASDRDGPQTLWVAPLFAMPVLRERRRAP